MFLKQNINFNDDSSAELLNVSLYSLLILILLNRKGSCVIQKYDWNDTVTLHIVL